MGQRLRPGACPAVTRSVYCMGHRVNRMIYELSDDLVFPDVELAEPRGLLAFGGDLSVDRLLLAYRSGIFPWYGEDQPILWWSPDPRFVLFPDKLKVSKSLRRVVKSGKFEVTFDRDFAGVIANCRTVRRKHENSTWITPDMQQAYCRLHEAGHAHSVEAWLDDKLVGGLYGVVVGTCFCGESMFAHERDASKVALVTLVEKPFPPGLSLIDCQVRTPHLGTLGAEMIQRTEFVRLLRLAQA